MPEYEFTTLLEKVCREIAEKCDTYHHADRNEDAYYKDLMGSMEKLEALMICYKMLKELKVKKDG